MPALVGYAASAPERCHSTAWQQLPLSQVRSLKVVSFVPTDQVDPLAATTWSRTVRRSVCASARPSGRSDLRGQEDREEATDTVSVAILGVASRSINAVKLGLAELVTQTETSEDQPKPLDRDR